MNAEEGSAAALTFSALTPGNLFGIGFLFLLGVAGMFTQAIALGMIFLVVSAALFAWAKKSKII